LCDSSPRVCTRCDLYEGSLQATETSRWIQSYPQMQTAKGTSMKIRFPINFGLWIGVVAALYVWLYLMSPLAAGGVLPCTFIAVPIFLSGGGKKEQIGNHITSAIIGVAWGVAYIKCSSLLSNYDLSPTTSTALTVLVLTSVLCAIHGIFKPSGLFCSIPMMFGAIASTLFAGPEKWIYLMITLPLGVLLGYACIYGSQVLDENGRWAFFRNRPVS